MSPIGTDTSPFTGERILELARQHIGQKYILGTLVPKNNPNWKGPWDCSEFVSWVVFQVAATLYGCDRDFGDPATADAYTGYWERDAKTLGTITTIEVAARTPGAAVLRIPQVGATGHVVISDGTGGTVEAHSSKDGVIELKVSGRRWDLGILVPGIVYVQGSDVPVVPPSITIYRLTTPMMCGEKVRQIQQALSAVGFDPGRIDGEFGPHTHAAVVAFQLARGLVPDGEVGPFTAAELGVSL
jgi:hypothetical protein